MTDRQPDATKNLQIRVSSDYAAKVAALAQAQGKTTAQLIRDAMDAVLEESQHNIEELRAEIERRHRQEQAKIRKHLDG